jgi:uncharacterized membrane protein YeiH
VDDFHLPRLLDYIATLTWATTGAMVGARKHFDVVGVFVVSLLSAMGGGLLRDGLILQRTPVMLTDPAYLPLVAAATLVVLVFASRLGDLLEADIVKRAIDTIDAVGTAAFAVVGMQLAEERGLPIAAVLFVGVANGVMGGILRDMVVGEVPALLRPGQFSSLSLLFACSVFQGLVHGLAFPHLQSAWMMIGLFFALRILAITFNWRTAAVISEGPDKPR